MMGPVCERVMYPASTYVWCKGTSAKLGRHPIFASSPVTFEADYGGRVTVLRCNHSSCSAYGKPTDYAEKEIGFQDGYAPPSDRTKLR